MKAGFSQCRLLLAFLFLCGAAYSQGFPWNDFRPRTLKEIVNMEADVEQRNQKENTIVFHADMLLSKVRVIYRGTSRPISKVKKDMIRNWAKMAGNPEEYANNYESDFLFTEDGAEYWLPVQKKVSAYFDKELKVGDAVDLYLVRAGAIRTAVKWDWLLLVEEYQKSEGAAPASGGAQDSMLKDTVESKYKVGQVWSYKNRPGEEGSVFVVVKVENHPKLGNIVHVAVRGLKMKNRHSPDGFSDKVNHMPFSEEAIDRSAVKLLKERAELPDYKEGYQMWREAFDAGSAGVYTITLAEAVTVMEATLNQ